MKKWVLALGIVSLLAWAATPDLRAQNAAGGPSQDQTQDQDQTPNPNDIVIPEGTEFKLQLHTTINSRTSKVGDRVLTTLLDPVSVEDTDVLPKGLRVDGHIGEVKPARRRGKGGYLSIEFDTVEMPNGEKLAILGSLTEVFSSETGGSATVGPEGDLRGGGANHKEQAIMIVAPAAAAGAAGGIGPGIAAAGAGIAAAILLPRGKQAGLSAGSLIGMRLDRDVTITLPPSTK
ncbi:MAG TPA: hypothetical protein VGW33_08555 [Terriglobia bacterium]|nr:hypothetical protein [Terriglobia bacterium]